MFDYELFTEANKCSRDEHEHLSGKGRADSHSHVNPVKLQIIDYQLLKKVNLKFG